MPRHGQAKVWEMYQGQNAYGLRRRWFFIINLLTKNTNLFSTNAQNGGFQNHRSHLLPTGAATQWRYASTQASHMACVLH
jgi:hypothetical protein